MGDLAFAIRVSEFPGRSRDRPKCLSRTQPAFPIAGARRAWMGVTKDITHSVKEGGVSPRANEVPLPLSVCRKGGRESVIGCEL